MISKSKLDRAHRFLWNQYGSKGVDICSVQLRVWIGRAAGLDPVKDKDEIIEAVNRLKAEDKIVIHESRVEIHGPNGERFDFQKLISENS